MDVNKLILHNIGRFEHLEIPIAPVDDNQCNVTVFVGNNGSGKTSILQSLATALSWLVARIQSHNGKGSPISELAINNHASFGAIDLALTDRTNSYLWRIAKAKKGKKAQYQSQLAPVSALASLYRDSLTHDEKTSLPLMAFYGVERVVTDIPLRIKKKHTFLQLDGYDQSLSQGVDFRRFFEWYREREDSENESGLSADALDEIKNLLGNDQDAWSKLSQLKASKRDRQLNAVRSAIYRFMPEFSNLRVRRKPRLHMSIDKNGNKLDVTQLSQGEKSLMALVGDIARRLAVMNPSLENPLHGDGIVLIDEVDMHLHPKWQRSLIEQLISTFPNCQFVLTTHSPLVISDSKNVLGYLVDEQPKSIKPYYGEDVNTVLLEVMKTDIRNSQIERKINELLDDIHYGHLEAAKDKLAELEQELPADNLALAQAKLYLRKKALILEKNN